MNNISQNDAAAIPFLSKLPVIGPLFKSMSNRAEQTELLVLITPRLVRPLEPDEVPPLPTDSERFIDKTADARGAAGVSDRLEGGAGLVDAPRSGSAVPR
jgi:pilus assembly protein CpaC